MADEMISTPVISVDDAVATASVPEASDASFGAMLKDFERTHSHRDAAMQMEGTVVSLDAESVYLDIGFKTEGVLPRGAFAKNADEVTVGETLPVSVKGRNLEGYYELSRLRVAVAKDWTSLEEAFERKIAVTGTVTGVVKGGLTVDVGVRAFLPASRSGMRDAAEMEKLVGQAITCRITKLDTDDEDVVVDRRIVLEEEAKALESSRFEGIREGEIVSGTVRSLTSFGAFVDLGGVDGLLHVSDIAWSRVESGVEAIAGVLTVGQRLELKVLKVDAESRRISLGLKQMGPEPWETAGERYVVGQRISGVVTRLMDFGAFVELEPGIEGLIHVSEMSWVKKVRKPADMLTTGDTVEAVILAVSVGEKRISLGLKQALGDPWVEALQRFVVGAEVEGPVTRMMKFGAFVELTEGVEGLVHVSEIVADRHIQHPQDVLRVGQVVKAQVVAVDAEKRQLRLSMKQLIPTGLGEYLEEHSAGDVVSGRVVEVTGETAVVELGEGIRATCRIAAAVAEAPGGGSGGLDLSQLGSMLKARWKEGGAPVGNQPKGLEAGQVRRFKIAVLERETKVIGLELA